MGDLQSKFAYLRRLAPADRKIKQRNFENRLGLAPGTLSDEFLTTPKSAVRDAAPVEPKPKAKAKKKTTKKRTTKKKATKKKAD
tara:strand:- start:870 stop:1121 length:252 start_codon:yes stop_codon:yes gene_type:complete